MNTQLDIGFPGGKELLEFSNTLLGANVSELNTARRNIEQTLGPAAVTAASSIAASFSKNDRVANGSGIPAEPRMMDGAEDIREMLGLKKFRSAINTYRHLPEGHP